MKRQRGKSTRRSMRTKPAVVTASVPTTVPNTGLLIYVYFFNRLNT